jgi:CRISPR-associated endonuclease/helicase Cas3
VIEAFRRPGAPAVAVCSQVAEMSLDLSATLLVTDLAPVPALIQRLGRLNRRARPAPPGEAPPPTMSFVAVEPREESGRLQVLPYTAEALEEARRWLESLGPGPLAQAGLVRCWQTSDAAPGGPAVASAWLDGGPRTAVTELRQSSPEITVVLEQDLPRLREGVPLARLALPMPEPPPGWRSWERYRGVLPVAPASRIAYDPLRGARWL